MSSDQKQSDPGVPPLKKIIRGSAEMWNDIDVSTKVTIVFSAIILAMCAGWGLYLGGVLSA